MVSSLKRKARIKKKKPLRTTIIPKRGEPFTRRHLTPIARDAYLRLSQIYGIPLKELLPSRLKQNIHASLDTHTGNIEGRHEIFLKQKKGRSETEFGAHYVEEELLHSIQYLLDSGEKIRRDKKYQGMDGAELEAFLGRLKSFAKQRFKIIAGIEPTAHIHKGKARTVYHSFAYAPFKKTSIPFILLNPYITISWVALGTSWGVISRIIAKKYYRRHGADGLILLYADPPKNWNTLRLGAKEKYFVENGLLKEDGGLTRKGIKHLRDKVPRGVLLENLGLLREEPNRVFERAFEKWKEQRRK